MKKLLQKGWEFWAQTLIMLGAFMRTLPALAAGGDLTWKTPPMLESLMKLMGDGFTFIGIAIVVFGAVQIAFAFRSDDAEGKAKGLRSAVSGAIVAIVGAAMKAGLDYMKTA